MMKRTIKRRNRVITRNRKGRIVSNVSLKRHEAGKLSYRRHQKKEALIGIGKSLISFTPLGGALSATDLARNVRKLKGQG